MAEHVPHYDGGRPAKTYTASGAITAGQLVKLVGNMTVSTCTNDSTAAIGVAGVDAADTALVPVYEVGVHDLTASGAIAAGALVTAAASGAVKTVGAGTFDQVVGKALEAISDTAKGRIQLNLA